MATKEKLKKKNLKQLKKEYSQLGMVTGLLTGITTFLLALTLYSSISKNKFDPLLITSIGLIVVIVVSYKKVKSLKTEIQLREKE